jgi:hypothetical protein
MDYESLKKELKNYKDWEATFNEIEHPFTDDRVNSPSHYTSGKVEAIEVIEDAIKDAPNVEFGFLQGQVLKYLLRMWLKDNPLEDAKKARWYLDRLIEKGNSAR